MPPEAQHVTVLRVVIREDFSRTFAERLVIDIEKVLHELDALPSRSSGPALQHPNGDTVSEKDLARQREVVSVWKRAVAARKKTQGVC